MFTNAKLVLCVAAVLGSTSAAQTAPQRPTIRQIESIAQHQVSRSVSGDDSFAPAPGQSTRANAVYFDPSPAPFPRARNGSCRESSGFPLSAQHQMCRCKLFHRSQARRCRSTRSKFRKSPDSRAAPKHKSPLRRGRSLMSPRAGFIMQISW